MNRDEWKKDAACIGMDTEIFFDKYEEDLEIRPIVDAICADCPVIKECFARAVTGKGVGVWGGIYFDNGKISKEFNKHRTKADWAEVWKNLTLDSE